MDNIKILQAVINTINAIKTDDTEGNWSKLLACKSAIQQVISSLEKISEETIKMEGDNNE